MVAVEQRNSSNAHTDGMMTLALLVAIVSVETVCMVPGYQTGLRMLGMLLPFRLVLWTLLLRHQCSDAAKLHAGYYLLLALPYVLAMQIDSTWFMQLAFEKVFYLSSMLFTPVFVGYAVLYSRSKSLILSLEVMSLFALLAVLILQTVFADTSFWQALAGKMHNAQMQQLLMQSASLMTSSIFVQCLLAPSVMATLWVVLNSKQADRKQDWLTLRMSWTAFYTVIPLMFLSYLKLIVQQNQLMDLSAYPVSQADGLFEMIRFVPAVCGLSYIHYRINEKWKEKTRVKNVWMWSSAIVFYVCGAIFYPFLGFLGLIDRVADLRQAAKSKG